MRSLSDCRHLSKSNCPSFVLSAALGYDKIGVRSGIIEQLRERRLGYAHVAKNARIRRRK